MLVYLFQSDSQLRQDTAVQLRVKDPTVGSLVILRFEISQLHWIFSYAVKHCLVFYSKQMPCFNSVQCCEIVSQHFAVRNAKHAWSRALTVLFHIHTSAQMPMLTSTWNRTSFVFWSSLQQLLTLKLVLFSYC